MLVQKTNIAILKIIYVHIENSFKYILAIKIFLLYYVEYKHYKQLFINY